MTVKISLSLLKSRHTFLPDYLWCSVSVFHKTVCYWVCIWRLSHHHFECIMERPCLSVRPHI